jgi:transcriptional regulator with XRE-family HTH domain
MDIKAGIESRALGEVVRAVRAHTKVNQKDLADRLGWKTSSLSAIENGRNAVDAAVVGQLCTVLKFEKGKLAQAVVATINTLRAKEGTAKRHELYMVHEANLLAGGAE